MNELYARMLNFSSIRHADVLIGNESSLKSSLLEFEIELLETEKKKLETVTTIHKASLGKPTTTQRCISVVILAPSFTHLKTGLSTE